MFYNVRIFLDKKFDDLIEFKDISDTNYRGGFVEFKWATEDVDSVIIAEMIDSDGELVKPRPYFVESLLRFPIIYFPDHEIRKYLFFPAKRKNNTYQYDSNVFKEFYVGKTIEANYNIEIEIQKGPPSEDEDKRKGKPKLKIFSKLGHIFPSVASCEKQYKKHEVEIITSTDRAYEHIWYTVSDDSSERSESDKPATHPDAFLALSEIKYPITDKFETFSDNGIQQYRYRFYICTETDKSIKLKSDPAIINLRNEKEFIPSFANSNIVDTNESKPDFLNVTNDIYCLNVDCMHVFEPQERTVKLKPTIDVVDLRHLYNSKLRIEELPYKRKKNYDDDDEITDFNELDTELTSDKLKYVKLTEKWEYYIHQILFGDDIAEVKKATDKANAVKEKTEEEIKKAENEKDDASNKRRKIETKETLEELTKANAKLRAVKEKSENERKNANDELNRTLSAAKINGKNSRKFLFYYGLFIKEDYGRVLSEKLMKEDINSNVDINDVRVHLTPVEDGHINIVKLNNKTYINALTYNEVDYRQIRDQMNQSVSDFSCPKCGKELLPGQGQIETNVVLLVGDTFSGKSVYLANTLRAYLQNDRFLNEMGITVNVSQEAEEYLDDVKSKIGKGYHGTPEISKPLYFKIKADGVEKYLVIYDIPGEWFSNSKYYAKRAGTLLRIFKASKIILFLYPIESINIPGGERPTTSLDKFIMVLQDDIFNGTLPDDEKQSSKRDLSIKGLNDRKMAFILSKVDKWREGVQHSGELRLLFHEFLEYIDKLLQLKGIETELDIYVSDTEEEKKKHMYKVIDNEIEFTRDFFKKCLHIENALIENELLSTNRNRNFFFFSYGSPEDKALHAGSAVLTGGSKRRYAAIRPFNSIQWIINEIFKS